MAAARGARAIEALLKIDGAQTVRLTGLKAELLVSAAKALEKWRGDLDHHERGRLEVHFGPGQIKGTIHLQQDYHATRIARVAGRSATR